jgi:Holliday junction resolvase RusA-like endonuclease
VKAVAFTIPGEPVGKPRMTQRDKWLKGSLIRPAVRAYRNWAEGARLEALRAGALSITRPCALELDAYFGMPASWTEKRKASGWGAPHRSTPDVDNIAKALMDALYDRDELIYKLRAAKFWDDGQGARLEVRVVLEA